MTPEQIRALRPLLARAKAAGWRHIIYVVFGTREHTWRRHEYSTLTETEHVSLCDERLTFAPSESGMWVMPLPASIERITAFLELAGALPKREPITVFPSSFVPGHPGACSAGIPPQAVVDALIGAGWRPGGMR